MEELLAAARFSARARALRVASPRVSGGTRVQRPLDSSLSQELARCAAVEQLLRQAARCSAPARALQATGLRAARWNTVRTRTRAQLGAAD